jgi:hypothetical protein
VDPLLTLALVVAAGAAATRLPRRSPRLPPVVELILAAGSPLVLLGLLLGPGIAVLDRSAVHALAPVTALAIGWLGALFGTRFEWRTVRRVPAAAWTLATVQAVAVFALVAAAAWGLARLRPALGAVWATNLPAFLTLGAVAVVSGPGSVALAARAAGIRRSVARPYARAALLDTLLGAVLFTVVLALHHPRALVSGIPLGWLGWLAVTVGSGMLAGMLFLGLVRVPPHPPPPSQSHDDLGIALLGVVLLGAGLGYAAGLSPFTICALAGALIVNLSPPAERRRVRHLLDAGERPVYAVSFIMVGALLALPTAWTLLAVLVLGLVRILAKWGAAWAAGRAGPLRARGVPPHIGFATVAQGGVALALALTAHLSFPAAGAVGGAEGGGGGGGLVTTIALGVLLAQLAAPVLLVRAGTLSRLTPPVPAPEVTG